MTISQAKEIPVGLYAERLGAVFKHRRGTDAWYLSPFRDEKTASFKVNEKRNVYKDFGDPRGQGSIIDLYCDFHNKDRRDKQAVSDALKELENFSGIRQQFRETHATVTQKSERYRVDKWFKRIKAQGLVNEVVKRGLPVDHVELHFTQVLVEDTETIFDGKTLKFYAFAMKNNKDGVETCAYYPNKEEQYQKLKLCIGSKGVTHYPADPTEKDVVSYNFSSAWDMITWDYLHPQQPNEEFNTYHGDSIVLSCAEQVIKDPRIRSVIHFPHQDKSGLWADAAFARRIEEHNKIEGAPIIYGTMEHLYTGYKDLSDCYSNQPQTLRAALNIVTTPKVFYESIVKSQNKPKL